MIARIRINMWRVSGVVALLLVLTAPRASEAQAQKPQIKETSALSIQSVEGKDTFAAYCAVCHGRDAKGNGPAVPALKGPVPDLTTIARRNAGKFDSVAMERIITGKDRLRPAHGTDEMPMWGPVFRSMRDDAVASVRITNLVNYLGSVQER